MHRRFSCLVLVGVVSLISSCTSKLPAPPATPTAPILTSTPRPAAGTVIWTIQTGGSIYASPAVQNDTVYIGSDDGNLYAVSIAVGEPKWKFETQGPVRSRPAIAEDTVYFASDDGNLYAVKAESGTEKWRLDIGNAEVARILPVETAWDYLQSSPAVAEGTVYIGSADGNLYAVDVQTGKEKWHFPTEDRIRSSPAVAEGVVYVGSWDGKIYAVDAQTGKEKWQFDTKGSYIPVQPSPAINQGVVYCGSRNPFVYALDAQTGEEVWRYNYGGSWVESSATVVEGVVYVGSSDSRVLNAIDAKTGELKWKFPTKAYAWSSPAFADGVVYIGGAYYGNIPFFFAVDAQTGQERWHLLTGKSIEKDSIINGVISSPAVAGDLVFFGGLDGNLYAVAK